MPKETEVIDDHECEAVHNALRLYQYMVQCHAEFFQVMLGFKEVVQTTGVNQRQRVDTRHLINQVQKLADDMRKEAKNTVERFDKITAAIWVKEENAEPIRGDIATGSPQVKMGVNLPGKSRDPEGYSKLMRHFGLDELAVETGAVRCNWPGMVEYVSQLAEQGKPLPPGVDPSKQYPIYSVTTRQKPKIEIKPKGANGPLIALD